MTTLNLNGIKLNEQKDLICDFLDKLINHEIESLRCINIISENIDDWFTMDDNKDFNGWQCDWWDKMTYKGRRISVSGSAWYGTVSFSLIEE